MRHVFFASFDDEASASSALAELQRRDRRQLLNIEVHRRELREQAQDLLQDETHSLEAGLRGILVGAAGGVVVALILTAFHFITAFLPALLITVIAGGAIGALGGMLYGSASPDHKLDRAVKAGEIVITIDAPDLTVEEYAEKIAARHGGRVERKPVLS